MEPFSLKIISSPNAFNTNFKNLNHNLQLLKQKLIKISNKKDNLLFGGKAICEPRLHLFLLNSCPSNHISKSKAGVLVSHSSLCNVIKVELKDE